MKGRKNEWFLQLVGGIQLAGDFADSTDRGNSMGAAESLDSGVASGAMVVAAGEDVPAGAD